MPNKKTIKTSSLEQLDRFDLHTIEAKIASIEQEPISPARTNKLRLARQALRSRQRQIKAQVMEFESHNDRHLLFFNSTSNFSKLAGHSVLFFTMTIAERIHWRYSVKVDTDHYSISEDGTISFRSLDQITNLLANINVFPDHDLSTDELHFFKLTKVYSPEQIAVLRDRAERDTEKLMSIILPRSPYPLLYDAINQVSRLIYYQYKHTPEQLARETVGHRMILEVYDLTCHYLAYANRKNPTPEQNLMKIIELSRHLRNGMAFVGELRIIHHREICKILEHLVTIERIAARALQTQQAQKTLPPKPTKSHRNSSKNV